MNVSALLGSFLCLALLKMMAKSAFEALRDE